jgi:hypothetical protein
MTPELEALLTMARTKVDEMTHEEREAMIRQQAESWARAEASWPKPNFRWENGVKALGCRGSEP